MSIQPIGKKILVKLPTKVSVVSKKKKEYSEPVIHTQGKIEAIGDGLSEYFEKIGVNLGDTVIFGAFSGVEVTEGGIEYRILLEEGILGIIKK